MNILHHYATVRFAMNAFTAFRWVVRVAAITASVTAGAQNVPPNTAVGSMTVNGKTTEIRHAYSLLQPTKGSEKAQTILILTEKPLSTETLTERVDSSSRISTGNSVSLDISYDEKKMIDNMGVHLGVGTTSGGGDGYKTVFDSFSEKGLQGRLYIEGERNTFGNKIRLDVRFNTVMTVVGPPDATGKKAWDMEQGKVLAAHLNAVRSGNKAAIKRTVMPEVAKKLDGRDSKMQMDLLSMTGQLDPKTADIVYLRINGDTAKAKVTGRIKNFGEISSYHQFRRVGDVWLVAPPEL